MFWHDSVRYVCDERYAATHTSAGHSNVQTDIKEAVFLGPNDDLVAAGSDDGSVFIYDAKTGDVVKILPADEDVANCVQASVLCIAQDNESWCYWLSACNAGQRLPGTSLGLQRYQSMQVERRCTGSSFNHCHPSRMCVVASPLIIMLCPLHLCLALCVWH